MGVKRFVEVLVGVLVEVRMGDYCGGSCEVVVRS